MVDYGKVGSRGRLDRNAVVSRCRNPGDGMRQIVDRRETVADKENVVVRRRCLLKRLTGAGGRQQRQS
jgi:hypothetical protein